MKISENRYIIITLIYKNICFQYRFEIFIKNFGIIRNFNLKTPFA